jgi:cytochrome c
MFRLTRLTGSALAFAWIATCLATASPAAAGDAGKGKSLFEDECSLCHSATSGGGTIVGPTLFGVVGRKAGSVADFNYSPAMKAAGFDWSEERLHDWVFGPAKVVPNNKMPYGGLKNPKQLDDLVAYLATLK